jgi:signal transduction histidine kinase
MDIGSHIPKGLSNTFTCITLDIEDDTYIADIEVKNIGALLAITIHDLTEHYTLYQKLAQAKNELAIENEVLDKKTDVFEQQDQSKNTFLEHLSHELRTPLTHITSFTALLDNTDLDQQQKDYVSLIASASKSLNTMVDELLDFQRIASGKIAIKLSPFSFVALIYSLRLSYELRAAQKGLYFKLELDKKIPDVLVTDSQKLFQILTNLLDNALKFTDVGGITLKVRLNQKWGKDVNLSFQVSDTGAPIPKEKRIEIFESFARLERATPTTGSGLGLTVVKKLLNALRTDIKVTSVEKRGNTFYFDLSVKTIVTAVATLT